MPRPFSFLRNKMKPVLPLLLFALTATACATSCSRPASPSAEPSPSPSAPSSGAQGLWTLSFTADSTGERCELAKRHARAELRCGDATFAPLKSDGAEAVRLVEATAWAQEAAQAEPEQAGAKKRSFRMSYGQGTIEVFRYAEPSTSFGRLAATLDALVKAEHPTTPAGDRPAPRAFPVVSDRGLVTVQSLALFGPEQSSTTRVGADGSWTRSGAAPSSGTLDAKQLAAVRALVDEIGKAKPSTEPGLPCDAEPSQATRVLFGKVGEIGWAAPCAGPLPPAPVQILTRYLQQVAEGRPASELEQTRARPR